MVLESITAVSSRHTPALDKVIIRLANKEDASGIAELLSEFGYPCSNTQCRERLKRFATRDCNTLVATNSNAIAGFVGFQKTCIYTQDNPVGWILALVVSKRMRRKGVGTALLLKAEQALKSEGVEVIYLHSNRDNLDAHMFYKAHGYDDSAFRFTKILETSLR